MSAFSTLIIGHDSLALKCARMLQEAGHEIRAVVTRCAELQDWADETGIARIAPGAGLADRVQGLDVDWLLSIANLEIIPEAVLAAVGKGAVNFHDGPLPRYAGLNAPVWAILNGETQHGVTWHRITGGIDEGNVITRKMFDITPEDTALSLNIKCFAGALESFPQVIEALSNDDAVGQPQDLEQRSYYARDQRPQDFGVIDFSNNTKDILCVLRALHHGDYWNPLVQPKCDTGAGLVLVGKAQHAEGRAAPGTVLEMSAHGFVVATGDGALRLSSLKAMDGSAVDPATLVQKDRVLPAVQIDHELADALARAARSDPFWRARLDTMGVEDRLFTAAVEPVDLRRKLDLPDGMTTSDARARFAALALKMGAGNLALGMGGNGQGHLNPWVPLIVDADATLALLTDRLSDDISLAQSKGPFAADLPARMPGLNGLPCPSFALSDDANAVPCAALSLSDDGTQIIGNSARVSEAEFSLVSARYAHVLMLDSGTPAADLSLLPEAERTDLLIDRNATDAPFDAACIHQFFEAQAAITPEAKALIFEDTAFSYSELNARANRLAHVLAEMGAGPGSFVGLHIRRSANLLIGALAIQKAGAAYVPLDPDYPADLVALYVEDSGAKVILTEAALTSGLPPHQAQVLEVDADPRIATAPQTNSESGVSPDDLAYLIYTSGSTGRPKGVLVEHRNVASFFTGVDARIDHASGGVWLAVTSLSFDISVLELFWTLARGFTVVISGDEARTLVSDGRIGQTGRGMEFSLFYWGNDDGVGRDKYKMLLEGAEFADKNGFCAVWTPERHFHAFGGPYPNPSVTGAAVAAVTRNLSVRAGSCVAPLHHPARVAEEWAVIDNLTNGRAGLGIASGWQPHDFVLRPENAPPNNKPAMYDTIEKLRALWRGEEVEFPMADGTPHKVLTQPRPVSRELAIWVTTAGNPDTWREAGEIGANVLTHLLGQDVAEVGDKIKIYHQALRDGGRDPADYRVTLMLHSYVAKTRDEAREIARGPMKDYLRAAAGLIKQFAWVFPAFKKPKGVENPMQLDLGILSEDELEAILDFAFQRYFDDSGLFGTIEDCLDRVEQLKRIGVDEIACLIDYGIDRDLVLEGLRPLAEVLRLSNVGDDLAEDDFSIAAQIIRHKVTHLQCTPSMARMLVGNDEARMALRRVRHLMIGGEALPGSLVADLRAATDAHIENMYGPTETTIWSTTGAATIDAISDIGTPIANTQVYVLDDAMQPVATGQAGELYIGGAGVARGYWQRDDLTAERFLPDPFRDGGRLYRTGDLVRWRASGGLEFVGRADTQIKLRGYRIEPGEIEAAMEAAEGIRQAVVIAREDTPGNIQLVGYYLAGSRVDETALRSVLVARLPAHMVPAKFMELDAFSLTPNRKIDRKALPAPQGKRSATVTSIAPQAGTAGKIATIWSRILGVEGITPQDHFFDLGGHSLLAVQAHREIRADLEAAALSITDIFRFPVLSALAAEVDRLTGGTDSEAPLPDPAKNLRAMNRGDAMSRRRAMRAARGGQG
jgi:natural product biosynthesis luciferase-like monooxygenase protein